MLSPVLFAAHQAKTSATLGLNADLGISDFHTVIFAVGNRYDEGQHSEHKQQDTDIGEVHTESPIGLTV